MLAGAVGEPSKDVMIEDEHNAQELRNAIPPSSIPPQQQQNCQPEQAAPPNADVAPSAEPAPASNARDNFVTPENVAIYGETLAQPITADTIKDINELNEKRKQLLEEAECMQSKPRQG